jgi:hypothetical protein
MHVRGERRINIGGGRASRNARHSASTEDPRGARVFAESFLLESRLNTYERRNSRVILESKVRALKATLRVVAEEPRWTGVFRAGGFSGFKRSATNF